jgi:hypothetical protein
MLQSSSPATFRAWACLVAGVLTIFLGAGRIVSAILYGKTKFFMFTPSFAENPAAFLVVVTFWALVVIGGYLWVYDGIVKSRGGTASSAEPVT